MEKQQANLTTVKTLFQYMEKKDLDKVILGFTEEAVFAQPFSPQGADFAYRGKSEIRKGLTGIFSLINKINYINQSYTISADGNTVFFETTGEMTLANGSPYNNSYVFRVDLNDKSEVVKVTEYMNSLYLAKTFGLIPTNN